MNIEKPLSTPLGQHFVRKNFSRRKGKFRLVEDFLFTLICAFQWSFSYV
jgi:hypothetical protein